MKTKGALSPAPARPRDEEPRARASGEIINSVRPAHLRRLMLFTAGAGAALVALGAWLYVLQIVMHGKFKDIVADNTQRVFLKQPRRGDILDVHGHQLATSEPVRRVLADPSLLHPHQPEVARVLAPILAINEAELAFALRLVRTNDAGPYTNRFVDLKRKATVEQWTQVTQAMTRVFAELASVPGLKRGQRYNLQAVARRGVYGEEEYRRVYPSSNHAAHVIGYVREVERSFTNSTTRVATTEILGTYGIEHWLDAKLQGSRGWRVTETDRRQREVVVHRNQDVDSKPGLNAVLTIDSVIQDILETQLAEAVKKYSPKSACGVVVRPRTGEVLAMASLPDFDPNHPGRADDSARRNRIIADAHEPGSTFKIVVVSAALNDLAITLDDVFNCENGTWMFKGKPLRDHEHYGDLTVQRIITKSSNIGSAKIAVQRLGEEKLYDYVTRFGFGSRTGITLDGEVRGILNPVTKWDGLTISRIPMGHSISTTPLQMTMAMAAIANEGRLMRPMLVHGLRDASGEMVQRFQPQVVREVISPSAARQMVAALKTVPTKEGTAPKAALDHYTVAGKTGTAQVAGRGGYEPGKYISSFAGFFPADNAEICISILLEEPDIRKGYYGGQTVAPYFKTVAEQVANYLKIKPDIGDTIAGSGGATNHPSFNTVLFRP